jgi:hypothetical protein
MKIYIYRMNIERIIYITLLLLCYRLIIGLMNIYLLINMVITTHEIAIEWYILNILNMNELRALTR